MLRKRAITLTWYRRLGFRVASNRQKEKVTARRIENRRRSFLVALAYRASRLGTESRHGARGLRHERRGQRHGRRPPQDGHRRGASSSRARPQLFVGARIGRRTASLRRGQRQRRPQEGRARTRLGARRGALRQQDPQEEALQVPGVVAHRGACPSNPPLLSWLFLGLDVIARTQNPGFKPPDRSETPNLFLVERAMPSAFGRANAARLRVSGRNGFRTRATFPPRAASPDPASDPTPAVPPTHPPPPRLSLAFWLAS